MYTRFEARGYRNLDTAVDLGRVNVLVGPNNSGKSNFMRALTFASDAVRLGGPDRSWEDVIRQHGGMALVNRQGAAGARLGGTSTDVVTLAWEWAAGAPGKTVVALDAGPNGPRMARELTAVGRTSFEVASKTVVRTAAGEGETSGSVVLGTYQPMALDAAEDLLRTAEGRKSGPSGTFTLATAAVGRMVHSGVLRLRTSDIVPSRLAIPTQSGASVKRLSLDANDLANHLRHLESQHGEGLAGITERMAEVLPGLKRIWVRDVDGQSLWVETWRDDQSERLADQSDGTIMALVLATLLFAPEPKNAVLIDEPETNLHPAWLKVLAGWFLRATSPEQVLFSTHSPDLLDALTEGYRAGDVKLLVASKPGKFRNVEPDELDELFREGWELGDVYRAGHPALGGWPW